MKKDLVGTFALLLFFSINLFGIAKACEPKVENNQVLVEILNGNGGVISSQNYKLTNFLGYMDSISTDENTLEKLTANQINLSDRKKANFFFKKVGDYTVANNSNDSAVARIGGCSTNKLKLMLPKKAKDAPFIYSGLVGLDPKSVADKKKQNEENKKKAKKVELATANTVMTSSVERKEVLKINSAKNNNNQANAPEQASYTNVKSVTTLTPFGIELGKPFDSSVVKGVLKEINHPTGYDILYIVEPKNGNEAFKDGYQVKTSKFDNSVISVEAFFGCSMKKSLECRNTMKKMGVALKNKYGNPIFDNGYRLAFAFDSNLNPVNDKKQPWRYAIKLEGYGLEYLDSLTAKNAVSRYKEIEKEKILKDTEKAYSAIDIFSSKIPTENDGERFLGYRIQSESQKQIALVNFKKTNGTKSTESGVEQYTMDFLATIEFLATCRWKTSPLGEVEGFHTMPIPKSAYSSFIPKLGTDVKRGQKAEVSGKLFFKKTEQGWKIIHSYLNQKKKMIN